MFDSIVEAVFYHAERSPDRLCLADDQGRVSYLEFADRIGRLAGFFQKNGIVPGNRVVVEACQSIEYLAVELAVQLLGAVFVPLEHNCAPEKIAAIVDRVAAAALIACRVEGLALDRRWAYGELRWDDEPLGNIVWPKAGTVSEILFSTGTTGREKGIVLTHANDIALAENVIHGVGMELDNVEMIPSPMNHSHGLRRWYANMVNGSAVVLLGSIMNMRQFMRNMDEYCQRAGSGACGADGGAQALKGEALRLSGQAALHTVRRRALGRGRPEGDLPATAEDTAVQLLRQHRERLHGTLQFQRTGRQAELHRQGGH